MSTAPYFHPLTDSLVPLHTLRAHTGDEHLACGLAGWSEVAAAAGSPAPDQEALLIPIGEFGALLWNTLPLPLALRAADPTTDAVITLRLPGDDRTNDRSLWEHLLRLPPQRIQVASTVSALPGPQERPAIAPPERDLPPWLRAALEKPPAPEIGTGSDAVALQAGLLQVHDQLEASHELSQSIEGRGKHRAGDYWHAIMHRREPDASNSKYWFRRIGPQPLSDTLADHARRLLQDCGGAAESWSARLTRGGWDAAAFVDFCEECRTQENSALARCAREIQWIEMLLLLEQTRKDALA